MTRYRRNKNLLEGASPSFFYKRWYRLLFSQYVHSFNRFLFLTLWPISSISLTPTHYLWQGCCYYWNLNILHIAFQYIYKFACKYIYIFVDFIIIIQTSCIKLPFNFSKNLWHSSIIVPKIIMWNLGQTMKILNMFSFWWIISLRHIIRHIFVY